MNLFYLFWLAIAILSNTFSVVQGQDAEAANPDGENGEASKPDVGQGGEAAKPDGENGEASNPGAEAAKPDGENGESAKPGETSATNVEEGDGSCDAGYNPSTFYLCPASEIQVQLKENCKLVEGVKAEICVDLPATPGGEDLYNGGLAYVGKGDFCILFEKSGCGLEGQSLYVEVLSQPDPDQKAAEDEGLLIGVEPNLKFEPKSYFCSCYETE